MCIVRWRKPDIELTSVWQQINGLYKELCETITIEALLV